MKNSVNPVTEDAIETKSFQYLDQKVPINRVKSFCNVYLDFIFASDNFFVRKLIKIVPQTLVNGTSLLVD